MKKTDALPVEEKQPLNTQCSKDRIENLDDYLEKLKKLPPIDKKTETLLRALANAMLDRIVTDYNNSNSDKE